MALTEIISIIVLFLLLCYFIYKYISLKSLYFEIKRELNSQSLDYHLKRIKDLGYDLTLKAGTGAIKKKGSVSRSQTAKKKSESFDELLS